MLCILISCIFQVEITYAEQAVPSDSAVHKSGDELSSNNANQKGKKLALEKDKKKLDKQKTERLGIAGNPGAVNVSFGTGLLGELLGLEKEGGIRLGGMWIGDANVVMSGGKDPGRFSFNSLFITNLEVDLEKKGWVPGAKFGAAFLQFDGQDSNGFAGVLTGYNGLTQLPPLNRSELYELWWRQSLLDDKFIFRVGKSVPTFDFNNVARALPIEGEKPFIGSVSGLIYTPIFVNPSILGAMPGYYNSAWGITSSILPAERTWISYGVYDGSNSRPAENGVKPQTGVTAGPTFDSYYFNIGEIGHHWHGELPGKIALGGWGQSGLLKNATQQESGAQGFYALGSQTVWHETDGHTGKSWISFIQYGINNSKTMMVNEFFGAGLTGFGIIPSRPKDTIGTGLAISWLNEPSKNSNTEIISQFYYQAHLIGDLFLQPVFSYVPNPAINKCMECNQGYPAATTFAVQFVALF